MELARVRRYMGQVLQQNGIPSPNKLNSDRSHRGYIEAIVVKLLSGALQGVINDVLYTGCSFELTWVPGVLDYDFQLYLSSSSFSAEPMTVEEIPGVPGWRKIKGGPFCLQAVDGYLSAIKVRDLIQIYLKDGISSLRDPNVRIEKQPSCKNGSAVTLLVNKGGDRFSIEVIICVKLGDQIGPTYLELVAAPYQDAEEYWRISYARMELEMLRGISRDNRFHRVINLYRVMKIIKKGSPLEEFPNYFFKNCILGLKNRFNNPDEWSKQQIGQRFVDLLCYIRDYVHRRHGLMPHLSNEIDLLSGLDEHKMRKCEEFLQRVIADGDYSEMFLQTAPHKPASIKQERKKKHLEIQNR